MKNVDGSTPFRGNQHEVDIAPEVGHDSADAVQQTQGILRDDFDNAVAARRLVVAMNHRREARQMPTKNALFAPSQPSRNVRSASDDILKQLQDLGIAARVQLQEALIVGEMKHVDDDTVGFGKRKSSLDI